MDSSSLVEHLRMVVRVDWTESERGWGHRPDGYSLHLTRQDALDYISNYWKGMPDAIPDEYSTPSSHPFPCAVDLDTYNVVRMQRNKRYY